MNSRKMAAVVLATAMTGALSMSACSPQSDPISSPSASASSSQSGDLLLLNETLQAKLGDAYSDAWIEDNKLHVAVTTETAATIVSEAGAVPKLVTINAEQLAAALQAVSTWQAALPAEQGAAIHKVITDGATGSVTIFVAAGMLDAVTEAATVDKPTGSVPLVIKISDGLATPL
ncbi:hypothetical protein [Arthrobacter psychrolactophilus]